MILLVRELSAELFPVNKSDFICCPFTKTEQNWFIMLMNCNNGPCLYNIHYKNGLTSNIRLNVWTSLRSMVSFMSVSVLLSCRCHMCPEEEVFSLSVLEWLQETQRHHIPVYRRAVSISVQSAHGKVLPALNYTLLSGNICGSFSGNGAFLTDNYSKSSALCNT